MTSYQQNFLSIFIFICLTTAMVSCKPVKTNEIKLKSCSYYEKHKNGILYVSIIDPSIDGNTHTIDINTGASIYQKYSTLPISDDFILLSSSDIGYRIINKSLSGKWQIFDARRYIKDSETLYSIYVGDIIQTENGTMCNRIELVYINKSIITSYTLSGLFPVAKDIVHFLANGSFFINNNPSDIELKIVNDQIVINKEIDHD